MKILAIRGKNIASLAGEFELDFQSEPLASAGLFAISGPTGAGKSTLLDTLCLALYEETPRLRQAGSKGIALPDVGVETITPHSAHTLLRRGTADGHAEVDFVGNDGDSYRARWSVRRAGAKVSGKLQKSSMTLKRLADLQPIGGTNSEVKTEIERRIGLSFEQFTRAVLLAQNEFSAFLKADENERGELLETLTGSAVYSDISIRAFERAKAEYAALQRLNERLADQKPLSQEEREQLDKDSAQAGSTVEALKLRKKLLDDQLRWHEAWEQVRSREQQARADWHRHCENQQAAASRRAEFALIESVQAARPLLADIDRLNADLAGIRAAISIGETEAGKANLARQEADEALTVAGRILHDAEQAIAAAAPSLNSAKALDAQIEALLPAHQQADQTRADAQAAEARARQALQDNENARRLAMQAQESTGQWLAQHADLQALAENWPRWDTLFAQAAQSAQDYVRFDKVLAAAQHDEAHKKQSDTDASEKLSAAETALSETETSRAKAVELVAGFDTQALLAQKETAEARRDLLATAEQVWRRLADSLARRQELNGKAGHLRTALEQAESAWKQALEQHGGINAALEQAERSLKTAEAACSENVETLRAALETDQPCPVCGGTDHPYKSDHPQLHAMLAALQAEVAQCRQRAQENLQQQASQKALADGNRAQLNALMQQLDAFADAIRSGTQEWEAHAIASEPGEVPAAERMPWFAAQQQALKARLQSIGNTEQGWRNAAQARDKAQQDFETASRRHAALKEAAVAAKSAMAQAASLCAAAAEKRAGAGQQLDARLADLDPALAQGDWKDRWRAAPETFHAERKAAAQQWQSQHKARDESRIHIEKLDVTHSALSEALVKAGADVKRASEACASSASRIEEMRAARRALFDGKAVARIEEEFGNAIAAAKARLTSQTQVTQQCAANQTRCIEALEQTKQRLSVQSDAAEAAYAGLQAWLDRFNADEHAPDVSAPSEETLRALLSHPAHWIAEERKQLQTLDSNVQNAMAVLQERRTQRETHEQLRSAPDPLEAVQQTLATLAIERQGANEQAAALQLAIVQDNARRQHAAALLGDIEKQEAVTRVWAQLGELIGSADGKKFRNYAQQFTLDVLLGYANRHLSDLSRRYRLERIKDTLALMVIDQDMGDEVRSVHSLSGGESFLVSLALALGLASLSSNRVRVESLFIDEGFGSLDADTLRVAMDALDSLQQTGRKVGVISHVQEMTERIATKILVERTAGGKSSLAIV